VASTESNPYAPPAALVADSEPDTHGLKRRSLWLMLLFVIISFGLYYPIWFFRRRPGLNRLDSPTKLSTWPLWLIAAFFAVQFALAIVVGEEPVRNGAGGVGQLMLTLFQLVVAIVMLVQCFRARDIIQDHASPPPDPDSRFDLRVQLSGAMTFFFSIFYLQWAINTYVVGRTHG
jgi:hypothetical protein